MWLDSFLCCFPTILNNTLRVIYLGGKGGRSGIIHFSMLFCGEWNY